MTAEYVTFLFVAKQVQCHFCRKNTGMFHNHLLAYIIQNTGVYLEVLFFKGE